MGNTYKKVKEYINDDVEGIVLEIGSDRYEGSSAYFAEVAEQLGTQFITLDLDENMPRRLAECIPSHLKSITKFIHCDGTEWTKTCKHQISVLYLDNFDWTWHPDDKNEEQRLWYQECGLTMNNMTCQVAHLTQMQNLLPRMADNSIVCIDDTILNNGVYTGKGGAVVPYLLMNGFEILLSEDYGIIMRRGK